MSVEEGKRVAYWFSQKKKKKLNIKQLRLLFEDHGVFLHEIDFDKNLDEQGCFDAVIHKLTDMMIEEMDGNKVAAKHLHDFQHYLEKNPSTIQIDPLPSVRLLLDRNETYKTIRTTNICRDKVIHVPNFTQILTKDRKQILQQLKEAGVQFPFVCKKNVAHGKASHKMSIIFNESGLADVDPPCVAQTFIDHNALLYKLFVVSDRFHLVERPSLKNFADVRWKNHSTIFFNSHDISSADCSRTNLTTLDTANEQAPCIDMAILERFTQQLHHEIDMTMWGVDIIVCPKTLKHYVIDVNVFPGYDSVDDYLNQLVEVVMARIGVDPASSTVVNGVNGHSQSNGLGDPKSLVNGALP